jgi:hypothetical protein
LSILDNLECAPAFAVGEGGCLLRVYVRYRNGNLVPKCRVSVWWPNRYAPVPDDSLEDQTNSQGYADFRLKCGIYISTIFVSGQEAWTGSKYISGNMEMTVTYPE